MVSSLNKNVDHLVYLVVILNVLCNLRDGHDGSMSVFPVIDSEHFLNVICEQFDKSFCLKLSE